ncbi:MAG: mechanosensitive ion channel protein MscS [Zetaproteobacteria bacterium CG2_30_46_52]|nr:MAG: mechanosensitive ion channel protein MscS [Zetaproteobacteria bacterium CG2_30_46_52]
MTILSILALLLGYFLSLSFINGTINKIATHKGINLYRIKYISKTITIGLTVFFIILFFLLLGVEYSQVSLFLSSFFAVAGIALFAQWSILSNVTASLIIFFAFPYRVGDKIRIADKDGDLSGVIEEITMFHVILSHDNTVITYPNSLILQKAMIKLSEEQPTITAPVAEKAD